MERCCGACETHNGDVQNVRVRFGSHDWGTFQYCEEAIQEDLRRGLTVEIVTDQGMGTDCPCVERKEA